MASNLKRKKVLRIFLSSTFIDFREERDIIVKTVLRHLKDLLAKRGIALAWADLRWGVTLEQTETLQTVNVCLNELQRSDIVVGMLGERYGWHKSEKGNELDSILGGNFDVASRSFPWIQGYVDRSVTEIELLLSLKSNKKTFLYLRDPKYPIEAMETETEYSKKKLGELKQMLRGTGLVKRDGYTKPKEVAELILQDLTQYIEATFPIPKDLSPVAQEREIHEDCAEYMSTIYVERKEQNEIFNDLLLNQGKSIVVTGEPGVGKSSFMARNYLLSKEKALENKTHLMIHFANESHSSLKLLRRILMEIKEKFSFNYDIPIKYGVAKDLLREVLRQLSHHLADSGSKLLIIIDSLELIDQDDWIPENSLSGIIWAFSCSRNSKFFKQLVETLGCTILELPRMKEDLKASLIEEHLSHYSKKMSEEQIQTLTKATQTEVPAYLVTILNELNVVGNYQKLMDQIQDFLSANDISMLYEKIMKRLEADVNSSENPSLVADILASFHLAKFGLSEAEVCEINGIASAQYGPMRLGTSDWFIGESLLKFKSNYVEDTVKRLHVLGREDVVREKLLKYFGSLDKLDPRKLQEYPWQLYKLNKFTELKDYIFDLEVFQKLKDSSLLELIEYHQITQEHYSVGDVVLEKFNQVILSGKEPKEVVEIGMMLIKYMTIIHNSNDDNGKLINSVVAYSSKHLDKYSTLRSEALLQQVLFVEERLMDYDKAYEILDEVLEIRLHTDPNNLDDVYGAYLFLCGDACKYQEMEHWLAKLKGSNQPLADQESGGWGYRPYAAALFEAVVALKHREDYEVADERLNFALEILKARPPVYSFSSVLNWQGQLRRRQGRLQEALHLFEKAMEQRLMYYGPQHIEVMKIVENISIVREQLDLKDPLVPLMRKQAFDFRKKMNDWSYCMCCDVYIDFKNLESDLSSLVASKL